MYHDKPRRDIKKLIIKIAAISLALLCILFAGWRFTLFLSGDMDAQAATSIKQAILNAAVQCYAVEGAYPQTLAELEVSYGVRVNKDKFVVSYEAFASNVLPTVNVKLKK